MNILRQNNIEVTPKRSKIHLFSNFCQTNISHNPHKKEYAMKFSQVKKHFPHLKSCILFRGFIGIIGGLILYVCQNVYQNHVKSRNIYVRVGYEILYT